MNAGEFPPRVPSAIEPRLIIALVVLLILISAGDLFSPFLSGPTILRQTQTAMLTENFVREGFRLKGLYLTILGNEKPMVVYEFPIYNFLVGIFFKVFNYKPVWGQLVSLLASLAGLLVLVRLVRVYAGNTAALLAGLFFIVSPLGVMMRTAFQPDATALLFTLLALSFLDRWYRDHSFGLFVLFCISLLLGALTKYPVIVPYLPAMVLAFFSREGRFRLPAAREFIGGVLLFAVPFIAWYVYRGFITHPEFADPSRYQKFLVGDLSRFFSVSYYTIPFYIMAVLACSGVGVLFFVLGLQPFTPMKIALLIGIPFYFIVIPTVSDQHYYFFACTPIVAFFMAQGYLRLARLWRERTLRFVLHGLLMLYLSVFLFLSWYIMVVRQDRIMYAAARAVDETTRKNDLIFVMNMHNRTNGFGGTNPTLFYLSHRSGWNISPRFTLESSLQQIEKRRSEGAAWLVLTWYTPDLEPPIHKCFPAGANLTMNPGVDGRAYYDEFKKRYALALESRNFALFRLTTPSKS